MKNKSIKVLYLLSGAILVNVLITFTKVTLTSYATTGIILSNNKEKESSDSKDNTPVKLLEERDDKISKKLSKLKKSAEVKVQAKIIKAENARMRKERLEIEKKIEQARLKQKQESMNRKNFKGSYMNLDLNQTSGFSVEDFKIMTKGTELYQISEALVECEKEYEINGLFLLGLASQESGFGRSKMAKLKNNITGFQAYDADTSKAKTFESYSDCIKYTAKYLKENYISKDGKYYRGNTIGDVNKNYCTTPSWKEKINNLMERYVSILDRSSRK